MEAYEGSAVGRVGPHAVRAPGGQRRPWEQPERSNPVGRGDCRAFPPRDRLWQSVALKQNKPRWQFAVSSAGVKTAGHKQMLGLTASKVCHLTTTGWWPRCLRGNCGLPPLAGHSAPMHASSSWALPVVNPCHGHPGYLLPESTSPSSCTLHGGLVLLYWRVILV